MLNLFLTFSNDLDLSMTFKSNMVCILIRLIVCVKCTICVICHIDTCNTCYSTNLKVLSSFLIFSIDFDHSMTFKLSLVCFNEVDIMRKFYGKTHCMSLRYM